MSNLRKRYAGAFRIQCKKCAGSASVVWRFNSVSTCVEHHSEFSTCVEHHSCFSTYVEHDSDICRTWFRHMSNMIPTSTSDFFQPLSPMSNWGPVELEHRSNINPTFIWSHFRQFAVRYRFLFSLSLSLSLRPLQLMNGVYALVLGLSSVPDTAERPRTRT